MQRNSILCTIALSVLLMGGCTATSSSDTMPNDNNNDETMISEENAREIALKHAGLTADQVTFMKSYLDRDDNRLNYDVEFYTSDHKEYDYEIDPYTGKILDTGVKRQ